MLMKLNDRWEALKGPGGKGAAALVALKVGYEIIDAASNLEFVIANVPAVGGLLNSILATNFLILLSLAAIIAILLWPAELGPGGRRVRRMRSLLKEAADFHAVHEEHQKKFSDDSVHEAAWRMSKIHTFLGMSTRDLQQDLARYQAREHEKYKAAGESYDSDRTIAKYLGELRTRLKASDLDPSFLMPDTYHQFYQTDNWEANAVAVRKK